MSHHYYAATAFGWATGDTREQALRRIAGDIGGATIKRQKASVGGVAGTVCRVELPEAAHYTISDYLPRVIQKEDGINEARKGETVPLSEIEHVRIINAIGATVPRKVE